jgi:SAM-dependent methyltransferase
MSKRHNADAWGLPGVLRFFETERTTTGDVYKSEWFFLESQLREGISVLDIGCAQGGFASILGENLNDFSYTGVDINTGMIAAAKEKHPAATFHLIEQADLSVLDGQTFDLVIVLGILHLHEGWRDTLAAAWARTGGALVFDLREIAGPSIEDKERSYFRMDFGGDDATHRETILPYNLINAAEAQDVCAQLGGDNSTVSHYGYIHNVSGSACCPVETVMFNTWCLERPC